jgi:hypothetical protein
MQNGILIITYKQNIEKYRYFYISCSHLCKQENTEKGDKWEILSGTNFDFVYIFTNN